eukprot:CAMPEP_0170200706 /NCGR_PEP_ID=MMETSP0040_2-20121228/70003_1 /TAXON_ID=641309 /ORGANISM="Lotharella oceanica, Strain CCMP622" /LENGTH=210 /DNA_ID=CAMNT_0010450893 /DNA_START=360 /DNA_END=992 /DNA_ORIENTATION=-
MHFLYYGALPKEPEKDHALRISAVNGRIFMFTHLATGFSLILLGTSISEIKKNADKGKKVDRKSYDLFAFAVVLFLVSVDIIRLTSNFSSRRTSVWVIRAVVTLILIILPFAAYRLEPQSFVMVYALFMLGLVNVNAVGTEHEEEAEAALNDLPLPPKEMKLRHLKSISPDMQTYGMETTDGSGESSYFAPLLKRQGAATTIKSPAVCYL